MRTQQWAKFRGQKLGGREWFFGSLFNDGAEDYILPNLPSGAREYENHQVDSNTVGQYIYKDDVDGNEIYVGDIVERSSEFGVTYGVVVMENSAFRFKSFSRYGRESAPMEDTAVWADMNSGGTMHYKYKVLGNIHDEPWMVRELTDRENSIHH